MYLRLFPFECSGDRDLLTGKRGGAHSGSPGKNTGLPIVQPLRVPFACVAWARQELPRRLGAEGSTNTQFHLRAPPGHNGMFS